MRKLFTIFLINLLFCLFNLEALEPIVYLTYTNHPESSISIHWIAEEKGPRELVFQLHSAIEWQSIKASQEPLPEGFPFFINHIELTDLKPDSTYTFKIGNNPKLYHFHTLPTTLTRPIRFVVGGDIYHDQISLVEEMNSIAARQDPDFALLGGDIAYASHRFGFLQRFGILKENASRWLEWLKVWQKTMTTKEGFLIPLIPSLGNHDTMGFFDKSPQDAAIFYALFPIKPPENSGYHAVTFGDYLALFVLDSGHTHSIQGAQEKWLEDSLKESSEIPHKFALYHVGAFPSFRKPNERLPVLIRTHWVPLFEKYHLTAAFEHHDHLYKRTYPLKAGVIDSEGVLYLGDGAWGVSKPRSLKNKKIPWYIAKAISKRHIILVELTQHRRTFTAIDAQGNLLDDYQQLRN